MLNLRGIKARPHDVGEMCKHNPAMVEMHCSVQDLDWMPTEKYPVRLALHLPEYEKGRLFDPAALDETLRKQAEAVCVYGTGRAVSYTRYFDESEKPKVVFHPGAMSIEPYTEIQKEGAREQLSKTIYAMQEAAGDKVDILLENMPTTAWFWNGEWHENIMTTCAELREMCEKHGIGCTLDLCHLYLSSNKLGLDPMVEIGLVKNLTRHVHYSDAKGTDGEGLQIGEGTLPLGKYLAELAEISAVAVPEIWFGHENNGAGFLTAWNRAEAAMRGSNGC